jgi:ABC-type Zn uptake system ZnuABC Zn-binding protein ZnuA
MRFARALALYLLVGLLALSACTPPAANTSDILNVISTTQIVGDVVKVIAGDHVALDVLIPPDVDPHAFEPAPRDAEKLERADLIFSNGLNLEQSLVSLLAEQVGVVAVSDGITPLAATEGEEAGSNDPHSWMNPQNVKIWADNIATVLAEADPANADDYRANAEAYKAELDDLDAWAIGQIALIPAENRVLVTDHEALGYFAEHYGFEIVGALIPSYSTVSEPSAGELAVLETAIQQFGVKAIFLGTSMNPSLAERVAADTGVQLVPFYTEALSDANGLAPTYLDMIHYDVEAAVNALK